MRHACEPPKICAGSYPTGRASVRRGSPARTGRCDVGLGVRLPVLPDERREVETSALGAAAAHVPGAVRVAHDLGRMRRKVTRAILDPPMERIGADEDVRAVEHVLVAVARP